jgi:ParB/RepB/Spo0J family partition protein
MTNMTDSPAVPTFDDLAVVLVYPNPKQPRQVFDKVALEDLAASIEASNGLIEPIVVVRRPSLHGEYMIVAGERRWRAHLLGRRRRILAIIRDLDDDQVADLAIVENLQRVDISPMEEARAYRSRIDSLTVNGAMTDDQAIIELAKRWGMKQPWRITERLALLKLTGEHQEAFAKGMLSPSQATEMARLMPHGQRIVFQAITSGKCKTYPELRATVAGLLDAERQVVMTPMFGGLTTTGQAGTIAVTITCGSPVIGLAPAPINRSDEQSTREVETTMERRISELEGLVIATFNGNAAIITRKVRPSQRDIMAAKLDTIGKACLRLSTALLVASTIEQFSLELGLPSVEQNAAN